MKPRQRIEVANELGECVLWDEIAEAVWWTDIEGRVLYRLDWRRRALEKIPVPHRLASFGMIAGRSDLVAAFDCGLALFDPARGTVSEWIRPEGLKPGVRLNDGRVDRAGRFWVGSMVEDRQRPAEARLYCLDGGVKTHLSAIGIANGLAWSPDGTLCYFADSREKTIWRFAVVNGQLSERREFARCEACPDGATIDAEGYLWSAQWGGGCVIRYAPDGRIDCVVEVPVTQPTCVAFGGPDLDLLFVTSARCGLNDVESGAGDLFVYNVGVRGLKESRFQIDAWPAAAGREG